MKGNPKSDNLLCDFSALFSQVYVELRERVCEECAWSVPTFYRKMRSKKQCKINNKNTPQIIPALSNAEKEKITQVASLIVKEVVEYINKRDK